MQPQQTNDIEKVSVAICTYNGKNYILEQLNSIANQTVKPDEIVICDDCSKDDTIYIIKQFVSNTNIRVRLNTNDYNIGYTLNFQKCLGLCLGNLIFMSDQDDIWYPKKIENVISIFANNPHLIGVTHDGRLVDEEGQWSGRTKNRQIRDGYGSNVNCITGALSCIRSKSLEFILPIPEDINGHDIWMNYIFELLPDFWSFSDLLLQDLRRHSHNTSDWVVNSFNPISRIDVIKDQFISQVAPSYTDRLSMNKEMTKRLNSFIVDYIYIPNDILIEINAALRNENKALHMRQALADNPSKLARVFYALKIFVFGGYKYFNGYFSFIRDLLR